MASKGTRAQKRKRVESLFIPDVLHLHNIFQYAFDWNVMTRVSKEWKRLAFKYRDQFLLSDRKKALASMIPYHVLYNRDDGVLSRSIEWLSRALQTKEAQKKIILHHHKLKCYRYEMKGEHVDVLLQSPFSPSNLTIMNIEPYTNFFLTNVSGPTLSVLMGFLELCLATNTYVDNSVHLLCNYMEDQLGWRGLALLCISISRLTSDIHNFYTALNTLFSKKYPNLLCRELYCFSCQHKRNIREEKKNNNTLLPVVYPIWRQRKNK